MVMQASATIDKKYIGETRDHEGGGDVKQLIADLTRGNIRSRRRARDALVKMGKTAVRPLIDALGSHDERLRRQAAKTLSQISSPTAIPVWINALEDEDCDIRWFAVQGLVTIGDQALAPLLHGLERHSDSVLFREGARRVLSRMAQGDLAEILAPVLLSLEDVEPALGVLVTAFKALDQLKARASVGPSR